MFRKTLNFVSEGRGLVLVFGLILCLFDVLSILFMSVRAGGHVAASIGAFLVTIWLSQSRASFANYGLALAIVAQMTLITAAFKGHPWQIDTHMLYFVALAAIATMARVGPLLAAAGFVALHHAGMTIFMPEMVYPGGEFIPNLQRTALHGVIVVAETLILARFIQVLDQARAARDAESVASATERDAAIAARQQATQTAKDSTAVAEILRKQLALLAGRDLSGRIEDGIPEKFASLREDYNKAVCQLDAALVSTTDMAQGVEEEARSLQGFTTDLANRNEALANNLAEISESIAQITKQLDATTKRSRDAEEKARDARAEADETNAVTQNAIEAMDKIEKSSNEVSEIMDMIDDIAFQTNLLALNARVESARAGEAGRGFAVVASEVHGLSQRTADAASRVKTLIQKSEQEISQGTHLVKDTGRRLAIMRESAVEIGAIVSENQTDLSDRMADIQAINQTVLSLSDKTQQTAAQGEEMAALGMRLHEQSSKLRGCVAAFRTSQTSHHAKVPPSAHTRGAA